MDNTQEIKIEYKGKYKNGKQIGEWVFYHDNGRVHMKGSYKDGKETGEWVQYLKDGSLFLKVPF